MWGFQSERGLTHEGSNVADQAEQAALRREGATFTAANGDNTAPSIKKFSLKKEENNINIYDNWKSLYQLCVFLPKNVKE